MGLLSSGCRMMVMMMMMMMMKRGESMRLDLESGKTKCISDDIKLNALSVGTYSVVNPSDVLPHPSSHKLTTTVTSTKGVKIHHAEDVASGKFLFTAYDSGDYVTCFTAPNHTPPVKVTIDFDWKSGVEAKDWSNIATKGQINTMEVELRKVLDLATSITQEIVDHRTRDREMQTLNDSTTTRMTLLSFLSLVVTLSVAGIQMWHLKSFFIRKKLL